MTMEGDGCCQDMSSHLEYEDTPYDLGIKEIIWGGLQEMWKSGNLADITLIADNVEFPVHRVVLGAVSPFFMAMFSGGWTEATSTNHVELKGVSAVGLRHLLTYIYTGQLRFKPADVMDVLFVADQFQVLSAVRFCARFMEHYIDIDNCVDVLNISQMHNQENLENVACDFIKKNFQQVLHCKHHCRLRLSDFLYFIDGEIEGEDVVEVDMEMTVLTAVLEWLRFDEDQRMIYVEQVMEVVRFSLLSHAELDAVIRDAPFLMTNPACQKLIADAREYQKKSINERIMIRSKNTRVRNRQSILMTEMLSWQGPKAWILSPHHTPLEDPQKEEWLCLPVFPRPDIEEHEEIYDSYCLEVNGFAVVLFVHAPHFLQQRNLTVFIFDPTQFTWSRLAGCTVSAYKCITGVVTFKGDLIVFTHHKNDETREILRYSFFRNCWKHQGYISPQFLNFSACSFNDEIWIFGIQIPDSPILCYTYDPDIDSWTEITMAAVSNFSNLKKARTFVYNQQVLLSTADEDGDLSFDVYRPEDDVWNTLWINEGFSDLTSVSVQVMAGDNLFFLDHWGFSTHTSEMTLGRKFCRPGRRVINHAPTPHITVSGPGCIYVSLRIPRDKISVKL